MKSYIPPGPASFVRRRRGAIPFPLWLLFLFILPLFIFLTPLAIQAQSRCANPYIVQQGDWWTRIAQRCGVSYEALRQANSQLWAERGSNIRPGDRMNIPDESHATATPQPTATATPFVPPVYVWHSGSMPTGTNSNHQITLGFHLNDRNQYANIEIIGIDGSPTPCRTPPNVIYRASDLASCIINTGRGGSQLHFDQVFADVNGVRQEITSRLELTQMDSLRLAIRPTPTRLACIGASNPALKIGDTAQICTRQDRVTMREQPGDSSNSIDPPLAPGTRFTVVNGPICQSYQDETYPWWWVQTNDGRVGWLADAKDSRDPVFLCRVDSGNEESVPSPQTDYSGTWDTNFAELRLVQRGNAFTGNYIQYGTSRVRPIEGFVNGRIVRGVVLESGTPFVYIFDEQNLSFDGHWTSPYDGENRPWCGVRSGPLPEGCGFSGYWSSSIGGYAGWTRLSQTGAIVSGDFYNGTNSGTINGQMGIAGDDPHYSAYGTYELPSGTGTMRLDLMNLESYQFQGCWVGNQSGASGAWCGARNGDRLM